MCSCSVIYIYMCVERKKNVVKYITIENGYDSLPNWEGYKKKWEAKINLQKKFININIIWEVW